MIINVWVWDGVGVSVVSVVRAAPPADVPSIDMLSHFPAMHHANEGYHWDMLHTKDSKNVALASVNTSTFTSKQKENHA